MISMPETKVLPRTVSANKTYVMKGSAKERALEVYHLILAPSFACNLRCAHCYLPDHEAGGLTKEDVLRLSEEWSEIVVTERGPMGGIFHLKGGEPLMLPYLGDVLGRLEELKTLRFMMTTNGTLGDWAVVNRLERLDKAIGGGVQIIVSIDGSNEEVNARLRGPGNFEKAVAFVRRLREAGITVFLNNVIHTGNMDDVEVFVALALELDVQQVNFLSFVPRGFGEAMRLGRPNPKEIFDRIDAIWQRGNERVRGLLAGSLSDILHVESCGTCTSGECVGGYQGLLYIIPDGTVYSCPNLNYKDIEIGNMHSVSLKEIRVNNIFNKICTFKEDMNNLQSCEGANFLRQTDDNLSVFFKNSNIEYINNRNGFSYCFNRNW